MRKVFLFLCTAMLFSITTQADHDDGDWDDNYGGGRVARLQRETHELQRVVSNSYLRYNVKQAVNEFAQQVRGLSRCSIRFDFNESRLNDSSENLKEVETPTPIDIDVKPLDHNEDCQFQIRRVHQSWYEVDRYLYDTYYDYPRVYRQYQEVERALRFL